MKRKIIIEAPAKINLSLDVLGKRPDGYHEVEMVMQTIDLRDVVAIEETTRDITVTTDRPDLPGGQSNIAYRAARMLADEFKIKRGVGIHIKKNIPVAAGLAGGSADAAAVITGLNHLWDLGMSGEQLEAMGASVGSDVPFCIKGGTALARGRGEILTELAGLPEMWFVLVKPPLEVSTAEIYSNFNPGQVTERPDTGAMIKAVHNRDTGSIIKNLVNVLESVTLKRYPGVALIKRDVEEAGAIRALMSGSGPTVFGVAESRSDAEEIAERLRYSIKDLFIGVSRTWPVD